MNDIQIRDIFGIGESSTAVSKFIEKIVGAVGILYEPTRIRHKADAEAKAKIIAAKADIEIDDLQKRAAQRFIAEETIKQQNMESIISKAMPEIKNDAKPENMSDDWLLNFFEKARMFSDEQMQDLWAKILANEAAKRGKRCLVVERRDRIGGNCRTENVDGIEVHAYGAHIFHTDDSAIWNYVAAFSDFNNYINSPIANYKGEIYNLPFNMNTFYQMWGAKTPDDAQKIIEKQREWASIENPQNLEEQALSLVGRDIYEKLIKGYTEKQWGKSCRDLTASIIKRIPLRFTYDNNYFNDRYQGIPTAGYTAIIEKMLESSEVKTGVDFLQNRGELEKLAEKIIYTGAIDEYFDFCFGELEWRSLRFKTEKLPTDNFQGVAVVNYTDSETPFTRIIEHKHFVFGTQKGTIISREYPEKWRRGIEPYYPINDAKNQALFEKYKEIAKTMKEKIIFGGRLGEYRYFDMDDTIKSALDLAKKELRQQ